MRSPTVMTLAMTPTYIFAASFQGDRNRLKTVARIILYGLRQQVWGSAGYESACRQCARTRRLVADRGTPEVINTFD